VSARHPDRVAQERRDRVEQAAMLRDEAAEVSDAAADSARAPRLVADLEEMDAFHRKPRAFMTTAKTIHNSRPETRLTAPVGNAPRAGHEGFARYDPTDPSTREMDFGRSCSYLLSG
jgi:hypothetical protein